VRKREIERERESDGKREREIAQRLLREKV